MNDPLVKSFSALGIFAPGSTPNVSVVHKKIQWYAAREGVIIKWPLNDLFNDGRDVIISSWMAVIIIF